MGLFGGGAIIQPTTAPQWPIDTQSGVPSSTGSPPGREPPAFCHHSCPAHIFPTTPTPTLLRYLLFILQLQVQLQYCYFPDTPAQVRSPCLRAPELTFGAPVSKSMCLCNYRLNGNLGKGSRSLHVILLCLIQPDTHLGRSWAWRESSRCSQSYDLWGCLVKSSTCIKTQELRKQTAISNVNPGGALRADPRSRDFVLPGYQPTVAILQGRQALHTRFVHAAGPARG